MTDTEETKAFQDVCFLDSPTSAASVCLSLSSLCGGRMIVYLQFRSITKKSVLSIKGS